MARRGPAYNKHLTFDDRVVIEQGVYNNSTKTAIAITLGKDNSTIGKEIVNHRIIECKCSLPLECANYRHCSHHRVCKPDCPDYLQFTCKRRDRSPGACNGCSGKRSCRFTHYLYSAKTAQLAYEKELHESREGIDITEKELKEIGGKLAPLIKNGISPYSALKMHPEISICERTVYNYIESDVFRNAGIDLLPIDLRRQVSRRPMKKRDQNQYKKREDRKYLIGRLYTDYQKYIHENPNASVVQMDTVYNDGTNGPFMQTFLFMKYRFVLVLYHISKTSEDMYEGILYLENLLGEELFNKEVEVILTDRGTEFIKAEDIEMREDGTRRTRIFYCDPMASHQKGSLENHHELIRYICPKEMDLYMIGLTSQKAANMISSAVNSIPVESLNGRSAWEYLSFLNPQLAQKLREYGLQALDGRKQLELKPALLKSFRKAPKKQ